MSEEVAGTDAVAADSSAAAPGPSPDAPASSPDPNDFESRLRSDPEFALAEFKKQQAAASRANDRLRKADLAVQIADRLGDGDVSKGAERALADLMLLKQMRDHPEMARFVERFQSGAPIAAQESNGSLYGAGFEDEADPTLKQVNALQGNVARLEQQLAVRNAVDAFKSFAETPYGQLLNKEELSEVFSAMEGQARAWANTPDGRNRLLALTSADVKTIALHHLDTTGKLLELGERRSRQKVEQLRSSETDGPSRQVINGAPKASRTNGLTGRALVEAAMAEAKAELGIQ